MPINKGDQEIMTKEFFIEAERLMRVLAENEGEAISKAADILAAGIIEGGILQAFGSGHSYAAAIEICGRAGGLIPSKVINDPAAGLYESVEGVGAILTHKVRIDPNDVFVLISNSGRNPLMIELAQWVKEHGNKLIVVTALEASKSSSSRHSSGKLLYEFADVVLDNHSIFGDAALEIEDLDTKICGTSSFSAVLLLQQMVYEAVRKMVAVGYRPPVYKSANIDGGMEFNIELENQFSDRIFHM